MKDKIRTEILKKLENIDSESKNIEIQNSLLSSQEINNSKTIMIYISKDFEVETKEIIEKLLSFNKTIAVPVTNNEEIKIFRLDKLNNLKTGRFGILEPSPIKPIKIKELDLIIVPGVAFDPSGNRIGRGKGYYDRFLFRVRELNKEAQIMSLAYQSQIVDTIPSQKHDIKVNKIITEEKTISCESF